MAETAIQPPDGLAARGLSFWKFVTSTFDLDATEAELLREVCRCLDECEDLAAAVARDGATTAGSRGQVRVHPALGELRSSRALLGRLLAQLDLPDEDGQSLPTPLQVRGRSAARIRWGGRGTA